MLTTRPPPGVNAGAAAGVSGRALAGEGRPARPSAQHSGRPANAGE